MLRMTYMRILLPLGVCILASLLLSACSRYTVSVNEKRIYTPPPLLSDLGLKDERLSRCLKQLVIDQAVRKPSDLHTINCAHGGITSLEGLQAFRKVERINLNDNSIQDLSPLADMEYLQVLLLANNDLLSVAPLQGLKALKEMDVEGNTRLRCAELDTLPNPGRLKLWVPEHCRGSNPE